MHARRSRPRRDDAVPRCQANQAVQHDAQGDIKRGARMVDDSLGTEPILQPYNLLPPVEPGTVRGPNGKKGTGLGLSRGQRAPTTRTVECLFFVARRVASPLSKSIAAAAAVPGPVCASRPDSDPLSVSTPFNVPQPLYRRSCLCWFVAVACCRRCCRSRRPAANGG